MGSGEVSHFRLGDEGEHHGNRAATVETKFLEAGRCECGRGGLRVWGVGSQRWCRPHDARVGADPPIGVADVEPANSWMAAVLVGEGNDAG